MGRAAATGPLGGALGTLVLAWGVLLASVQVALALPGEVEFSAVEPAGVLDYAALVQPVSPLASAYIEAVLGQPSQAVPVAEVAGPGTLARPVTAAAPVVVATALSRPPVAAAAPPVRSEPGTVTTHAPTNDDFDRAYEVHHEELPFQGHSTARNASREQGEPTSCAPAGPTLWYRHTAARTGALVASTVGTDQPVSLAVFTGDEIGGLREIDCDTDVTGDAEAVLLAEEGQTYHFQVTGPPAGGATVFTLRVGGTTERVTLSASGEEPNGSEQGHGRAAVSTDGRYVAFPSNASNLVPDDNEPNVDNAPDLDVFVRDRLTAGVELVSRASDGSLGEDTARATAVSADGRYVAFTSDADNLVPGDTNHTFDVFVRDRLTGQTSRVSVSSSGQQSWRDDLYCDEEFGVVQAAGWGDPHGRCEAPNNRVTLGLSISADGMVVVFTTDAHGLIDGEPHPPRHTTPAINPFTLNACPADCQTNLTVPVPSMGGGSDPTDGSRIHVYAHDRRTGETTRVSANVDGEPASDHSWGPVVSGDGRYVVFQSRATNLAPAAHTPSVAEVVAGDSQFVATADADGPFQVYRADRLTGEVRMVSVNDAGHPGNADAHGAPDVSFDGRYITFASLASNLVDSDTNGGNDQFVYDAVTATIELVSVSTSDTTQELSVPYWYRMAISWEWQYSPPSAISDDGRYVAFQTSGVGLAPGDDPRPGTDCQDDVFVRDRVARTTIMVSVSSSGEQASTCAFLEDLSGDGQHVVFRSDADNLDPNDQPQERDAVPGPDRDADLFVHSLLGEG